jgi:hypothetical protein
METPKNASEAFAIKQEAIKKRGSAIDIGMGVGNALTNATNFVIALINANPEKALDLKDLEDQIRDWTNRIYKIGQDKKEFESIPVIDETQPSKLTTGPVVNATEKWDEKKQEIYNEASQAEEFKELT